MKLRSIEVENYRSIVKTQRLQLEPGLTVILGPNNEGKSNLLRAVVVAMRCLRSVRQLGAVRPGAGSTHYRLLPGTYDWETDFPRPLQSKHVEGMTRLALEFELNGAERQEFKKLCGLTINESLPLEIRVGQQGAQFRVRKPGKGAATYEAKSRQIAGFIGQAFDFQYIPAIRPSELSLEVVASLVDRELSALEADDAYQAALNTIEQLQLPILETLANEVQANLKQLLPSVNTVRIGMAPAGRARSHLRLPQFVVDDGIATELEAKGDGIKSLVAIALMRASKVDASVGDLVVAIEEPESHLHPGAVRQLGNVLLEMAGAHQVIITTHSPLLVSRKSLGANILVSKSKATPAKSIKAIRDALGVEHSDNLVNAEFVVVVEGQTDVKALSAVFPALSAEFAQALDARRVIFEEMTGTGNVVYKLRTLLSQIATPIVVLDDDEAGRACEKKIIAENVIDPKYLFRWRRPQSEATELEDLLDPGLYWCAVEERFGVVLDRAPFDVSTKLWKRRMAQAFAAGGKTWNPSVESRVKAVIAAVVAENPGDALLSEHEQLVRNVATAISKLISVYSESPGQGNVDP